MTTSLIYLHVQDDQNMPFSYPLVERMKKILEGVIIFDLDNHSGQEVIQAAIRLIQESDQVAVVIHACETKASGPIRKIVQALSKKDNALYAVTGENKTAKLMEKALKKARVLNDPGEEELVDVLKHYFANA